MSRRKRQQDRPKNVRYGTVRTDGRSSPSHQFTTTTEQGQDWKRELPGSSPGEGGHVAAIPPGTGSMVRANDPNRAGSGKWEAGSGKWELLEGRGFARRSLAYALGATLTKLTTTVSRKSTALSKKVQCTVYTTCSPTPSQQSGIECLSSIRSPPSHSDRVKWRQESFILCLAQCSDRPTTT